MGRSRHRQRGQQCVGRAQECHHEVLAEASAPGSPGGVRPLERDFRRSGQQGGPRVPGGDALHGLSLIHI